MPTIPLERLLRYQDALQTVLAEMRMRYREERGEAPSEAALPKAELVYNADVAPGTFKRDLRALDFDPAGEVLLRDFDARLRQRVRSTRAEKPAGEPPALALPSAAELVAAFDAGEPDSELARARELAWEYARSVEDELLFALAHFRGDYYPYVHQLRTAKKVVETMDGSAVVADEVGLGKTITAGLVLFELMARGLVRTSLIIVPSNLREQWREELEKFFAFKNAEVTRLDEEGIDTLRTASHVLLDLHRARTPDFRDILLERRWDLLIIDEAHRLRNAGTQQTRLCYSLPATRRLLLTATPVQNAALDVFNLVTQIRPGYLGSQKSFESYYVGDDFRLRHADYLQQKLAGVKTRTRRGDTQLYFARRNVRTIRVAVTSDDERRLHDEVIAFLQQVRRHYVGGIELEQGTKRSRQVPPIVVVAIQVLRQLSSHPTAALKSLGTKMRERIVALPQKIRNRIDVGKLDGIVKRYGKIDWTCGQHAKSRALVARLRRVLRHARPKIIVYAEFLETVKHLERMIRRELPELGETLYTYVGSDGGARKKATLDAFRDGPSPALLISTDCGGEGHNLQQAGVVVNFDFPWNPMKIEQRIGRIDRVKQTRKAVYVWNFITPGTIEAYVYAVLQEKLDVCGQVLGDFDSPITRVMLLRRTEDLGIGEIILSARDAAELRDRLNQIDQEPHRKPRRQYGTVEPIVF